MGLEWTGTQLDDAEDALVTRTVLLVSPHALARAIVFALRSMSGFSNAIAFLSCIPASSPFEPPVRGSYRPAPSYDPRQLR